MSTVDVVTYLKKILGKLPKTEFSSYDRPLDEVIELLRGGLMTFPTFTEHVVKYIDVTSTPQPIDLGIKALMLKLSAIGAPIYVNYDREVTDSEFDVIYPDSYKVVPRVTKTLWAKVPNGYPTAKLGIFGLGVGE